MSDSITTPWTTAHQSHLSVGFPRQVYIAMFVSRGSSQLRDWTHVSCMGSWILYYWATWKVQRWLARHLSHVWLFATQWTAACQGQVSLSFTLSWSLFKLMSIVLMMLSNHLILCYTLLLLPSIFPNIKVFFNESALWIR